MLVEGLYFVLQRSTFHFDNNKLLAFYVLGEKGGGANIKYSIYYLLLSIVVLTGVHLEQIIIHHI